MGIWIGTPGPSSNDLLLWPLDEEPPLCLVPPPERGDLCSCLLVIAILAWMLA